jgi:hypothetical protein
MRLDHARVVHEHVDAAERRGGLRDHAQHRVGVGQIRAEHDMPLTR